MKRLAALGLASFLGCGEPALPPSPLQIPAPIQQLLGEGILEDVLAFVETSGGGPGAQRTEPVSIDPTQGFVVEFKDVNVGPVTFQVHVLGRTTGTHTDLPLLVFSTDSLNVDEKDDNELVATGGWTLPGQSGTNQSVDGDVDNDGMSNYAELLGRTNPLSPFTLVEDGLGSVNAISQSDVNTTLVSTDTGIRYLGTLERQDFLNAQVIDDAELVAATQGHDLVLGGAASCTAGGVGFGPISSNQGTALVGGSTGCMYKIIEEPLEFGSYVATGYTTTTSVALTFPWQALVYTPGGLGGFTAGIDPNGDLYTSNGFPDDNGVSAVPLALHDYTSVYRQVYMNPGTSGGGLLAVGTDIASTPYPATSRCTASYSHVAPADTLFLASARGQDFSSGSSNAIPLFVAYRVISEDKDYVRELNILLNGTTDNCATDLIVNPEEAVPVPDGVRVTTLLFGQTTLSASVDGSGGVGDGQGSLFIGDADGGVHMVHPAIDFASHLPWLRVGAVPSGVVAMAAPTTTGGGSSTVRPLLVATEDAVYRAP